MQTPRGLREAGSKTREQRGYRFDGIGLEEDRWRNEKSTTSEGNSPGI